MVTGTIGVRKARGSFLGVTLGITAAANVFAVLGGLAAYNELVAQDDPSGARWLLLLAIGMAALNVGSVAPLWSWRRWGFYVFVAASLVAFAANLAAGTPLILSLLGMVGLAILYAAVRSKWQQFE
jgi:hypothetical protein